MTAIHRYQLDAVNPNEHMPFQMCKMFLRQDPTCWLPATISHNSCDIGARATTDQTHRRPISPPTSSQNSEATNSKSSTQGRPGREKTGEWGNIRGHMVADGEERRAGRARGDEAVEGVGVVDGGGVEQRHVRLGDGAHGAYHRGARDAAQVPRTAGPPQRPRCRRRRGVGGHLHLLPTFLSSCSFRFGGPGL